MVKTPFWVRVKQAVFLFGNFANSTSGEICLNFRNCKILGKSRYLTIQKKHLHPQQPRFFQYKINQRTHSGWFLVVL